MKEPTPDNFDDLLVLLSLKQHEQPPPEFFNDFSEQVLARIQTQPDEPPVSWWQRWFGNGFEGSRPILAGAYCVAVCGLLLSGLSLSKITAEEGNAVTLDDSLAGLATMKLPLTLDRILSRQEAMGSERTLNFTPLLGIEPASFQLNRLELRPKHAELFFEYH